MFFELSRMAELKVSKSMNLLIKSCTAQTSKFRPYHHHRLMFGLFILLGVVSGSGCSQFTQRPDPVAEKQGKTYYLDGAGNWGFGTHDVPEGLHLAGYPGDVEVFRWSYTYVPMLDQINTPGAKAKARQLARKIRQYKEDHPDQEVNIVALSAGSGVAIWALEYLAGTEQVNHVFLLSSSLSSQYDLRMALRSIKGRVYVYYSARDAILKSVEVIGLGTIDQKRGVQAAGQVGLMGRGMESGRIINIGWRSRWENLGWYGRHADCVNTVFVQHEIAPKLMQRGPVYLPTHTDRLTTPADDATPADDEADPVEPDHTAAPSASPSSS
ncbi:MAG: hypothetical protein HJJLKODD_00464 [Phycisphaerae bacterium]|nr:hypothetical protein [Phycisphaerae bacterium]